MKNKLIPKHLKAGKILINEPVSESTYRKLPPLSLLELQFIMMTNNIGRVPTQAELIMQEKSRQAALYSDAVNTGVIKEAKEDNIKNNFFRGYNNFRYSHPWAEGLSWTPIIGDGMDLIYLTDAVNNKDYMAAGLGLGMLALPNFILKPIRKYNKLRKTYKLVKNREIPMYDTEEMSNKIALLRHPDLSNPFDKNVAKIKSDAYKDMVTNKIEEILKNVLPLYKNLSSKDLTRLINIINISPEYGIFLQQNPTLNPLSLNTLDKFFERLSRSIRGVFAINDDAAKTFLATPSLNKSKDRLGIRGLYTSNSYDIADVFSRPEANEELYNSYIGAVNAQFNIDRNLSFELLLKLYRSYIDHYHDLGIRKTTIPGTIAKEATYVRNNGTNYKNVIERAFYPKNDLKVVNVESIDNRGHLKNLHGRWGLPDMESSNNLFIPKHPNNSLSEYITFMKAGTKEGLFKGVDPNEMNRNNDRIILQDLFSNLDKKRHELKYKAADKYIKLRNKVLGGIGTTSIPAIIYFMNKWNKNTPNTEEMSLEELNIYNNLLETINKKTNISIEELKKYSIEKLYSLLDENN